jgi:hypothetical protein
VHSTDRGGMFARHHEKASANVPPDVINALIDDGRGQTLATSTEDS